jgi:hypothetical protein
MILFLKLGDALFQDLVLPLEMDQEEVPVKGSLDGLDRKGRGSLEWGTDLHEKGVEKGDSFLLPGPHRHQTQGNEQQEDDQGRDGIAP